MIFQPVDSSSGSWVAGACPGNSGHKAGTHPGQAALPSQSTLTLTPTLTHPGTVLTL